MRLVRAASACGDLGVRVVWRAISMTRERCGVDEVVSADTIKIALMRRYDAKLPQGRNAARVCGLYRVRESFSFSARVRHLIFSLAQ